MKWRKISIYLSSLIAIVILLSLCYFRSYHNALSDFNSNSVEQNNDLVLYLEELMNNYSLGSKETNVTEVDSVSDIRVMPQTVYKLQIYDIKTNTKTETVLSPPSKLIGLNRDEVIELLAKEMENISLDDYQKGLISSVLISFSKDEIVIRKSYNSDLVPYKFYLALQDDIIIVYYSDKKTIYEYTGMNAMDLSETVQAELSLGKYVKDEEELYSLLESYAS